MLRFSNAAVAEETAYAGSSAAPFTWTPFSNKCLKIIETGSRYVISKVGEVPIRMPVEGRIKQIIYGEWFALICVEEAEAPKKEIESAIGIDLGIKSFRFWRKRRILDAMSDGAFEEGASCWGRKSNNWLKQLKRLCKIYDREEERLLTSAVLWG